MLRELGGILASRSITSRRTTPHFNRAAILDSDAGRPVPSLLRRRRHHHALSKLESSGKSLAQFRQAHAQIVVSGLSRCAVAATRLLRSSPPHPGPTTSLVFCGIEDPDLFSYNVVIKAQSRSSDPLRALDLYRDLLLRRLRPNEYTLCFLLDGCSRAAALREGKQSHAQLCKHGGPGIGVYAATSLCHMYGQCGDLGDALQVFDEMPHRSSASWASAIGSCVLNGRVRLGLRLFGEMARSGVEPGNAALVAALCACADEGDATLGRAVHALVAARGRELNITLGTSLVAMYSKCGRAETAVQVFRAMPLRSTASWTCLIQGLAMNGHPTMAIELFREMESEATEKPDGLTFLALLQACSHAGMVEECVEFLSQMSGVYGIAPGLKHYGCVVDLCGRAGRVEEAMSAIRGMPMEPDTVIWGAFFDACKRHGRGEMEELVAARIVKMLPEDSCGYLMLSEFYATARRWDEFAGVRELMLQLSVSKLYPGSSSVDAKCSVS